MTMHNPVHPGEILKELVIEPMELTITDVAKHLNVSRKTLSKVLNTKGSITPEMAIRLELVFGKPSADHWLRLQNAYDLWQIRQAKSSLNVSSYNFQLAWSTYLKEGGRKVFNQAVIGFGPVHTEVNAVFIALRGVGKVTGVGAIRNNKHL